MNNESTFDCSLFNSGDVASDAQLAQAVAYQCSIVGIRGLDNVRIPWLTAKAFSEGRGVAWKQLEKFNLKGALLKKTRARSEHFNILCNWITQKSDFNSFLSRLKYINEMLDKNDDFINRVVYSLDVY